MKKLLLGIMITGLLLFGLAGQGLAAFANGDLIRVVYDTSYDPFGNPTGGSYEYATDLGSLATLKSTAAGTVVGENFTQFTGTAYDHLQVAYYVYLSNADGANHPYIASTSTEQPGVTGSSYSALTGNMGRLKALYTTPANQVSSNTAKVAQSTVDSYWLSPNQGGNGWGSYAYYIPIGSGEASLDPLADSLGVMMWLYAYNSTGPIGAFLNSAGYHFGLETVVVDGVGVTRIADAAPVPVPPSLVLLAPGLLGLIGLRRRQG